MSINKKIEDAVSNATGESMNRYDRIDVKVERPYPDAIKNRYDFLIIFDVENGNPNGDPDADGMPRVDYETGTGIVTDVCIKRKIRDYIELLFSGAAGYRIYHRNDATLNKKDRDAIDSVLNISSTDNEDAIKKLKEAIKENRGAVDKSIQEYMCSQYYDVRTFGAAMTTFTKGSLNCGQTRGPVQMSFARSVDPVSPQEITITRDAVTTESDAENKRNTIGHKYVIPYALYKGAGWVSASLAGRKTGFDDRDLELLWQAIVNMFENDHSAGRGKMVLRKLIIFKHDSELGNCSSQKLFDLVNITKKDGVIYPRNYTDYDVTIDMDSLPDGVTCEVRD